MTWTQKRIGRFTASEIYKLFTDPKSKADKEAGLFGETAMTYILEKAVEQYTGFRKQFTSPEMMHGVINEEEAFNAFCQITDKDFDFTSKLFYEINQNAGASPDGVLLEGLDIVSVCDVKCPQPVTFFNQKQGGVIPKAYFYQLQMQMLATGAKDAYLAYYLAREFKQGEEVFTMDLPIENRLFFYHVEKDADLHLEIIERIQRAERIKIGMIEKFNSSLITI
jgi:hypothetical protein